MLREVKSVRFERRTTLLGRRYALVDGGATATAVWSARQFRTIQAEQHERPVPLLHDAPRTWWLFEDRVYWEDDELDDADVLALIRERERRQQRKLERAHAALAATDERPRADGRGPRHAPGGRTGRTPIPREVRQAVWERDGGRCVDCDASFDLQYDHVIPHALGGAHTVENLQILCAPCNQAKGASLG